MTEDLWSPWFRSTSSRWEENVREWLDDVAQSGDLGQIEDVQTIKKRPWSVVRRVTFQTGTFYFKACGSGGKHEPELLLWLTERWSDLVPMVQSVDIQNAWILMADAGHPLRETIDASTQVSALSYILSAYSKIQLESASAVDQLLDIGVPDRRVHLLPILLAQLIDSEALSFGRSESAVEDLRSRLREALPNFERYCDQLAASPCPNSIDHGDVHTGNVLAVNGSHRLCDWGDASITHPFCSMAVALETTLASLPEREREPCARRLRDAYLRHWLQSAPREQLHAEFQVAVCVAHIVRALDFARMFQGADHETMGRWQPLIAERLEKWVRHQAMLGHCEGAWVAALSPDNSVQPRSRISN